jgi:hypothetical protein
VACVRDRLPLPIGLALIAVAVVIGSFAIGSGIRNRNQNDVITVTGSAKQLITSDYAIWDFSITSQDVSAATAAKALAGWTAKTEAFLRRSGVQDGELTVYPISTNTVTKNAGSSNEISGYQLTRSFEVRSARVDAVQGVAQASSGLLTEGVPFSAQPLQYVYTKLDQVRGPLLAAAVRDAERRAKTLLAAAGEKPGKLRGVAVSPFQITPPNSTQVSDYGAYDTSTLRKQVQAVVNVTFGLG